MIKKENQKSKSGRIAAVALVCVMGSLLIGACSRSNAGGGAASNANAGAAGAMFSTLQEITVMREENASQVIRNDSLVNKWLEEKHNLRIVIEAVPEIV
ncbi:hypothetical protein FACS189442_5420 [Spirochaetia bacterium]|nr:hypothetical protein FACS189442_5420 [Spirochaetia bacterium]